jgi:hypothetical protein
MSQDDRTVSSTRVAGAVTSPAPSGDRPRGRFAVDENGLPDIG